MRRPSQWGLWVAITAISTSLIALARGAPPGPIANLAIAVKTWTEKVVIATGNAVQHPILTTRHAYATVARSLAYVHQRAQAAFEVGWSKPNGTPEMNRTARGSTWHRIVAGIGFHLNRALAIPQANLSG